VTRLKLLETLRNSLADILGLIPDATPTVRGNMVTELSSQEDLSAMVSWNTETKPRGSCLVSLSRALKPFAQQFLAVAVELGSVPVGAS
jgi:hypothetical protein